MSKLLKRTVSLLSFALIASSFSACGGSNTSIESTNNSDAFSNNIISSDVINNSEQNSESTIISSEIVSSDPYIPNKQYDVVVYGDTAAAVIASVAASRQNATVALVAPNKHLGGMMSSGLSQTDLGNSSVIGGMSRDFFKRNAIKKGSSKSVDWYFEPHVAEEIFSDMINETKATDYGVEVYLGERLVENSGVEMEDTTIKKIICESGKEFTAKNFIDASYEGDLMAQSKVSYTYGREGKDEYNESLAGVVSPSVAGASNHNFNYNIKARDDSGKLLYQEVSEEPLAPIGSGDKKIQAYNFRMYLTNDKDNMVPYPMPEGYDPERYALLGEYLNVWTRETGTAPTAHQLFGFRDGVNNKWDFNNKGAFSTDYIGGNYNYPDASYAERQEIWNEHYKYTAGLFYFLANDESVPASTQKDVASYGLPKDEFVDSNNWPFQLYVREGRRMLGEYIMTQKDIEKGSKAITKYDTIGMGSYNSDSHNVQRYITEDGYIRNEGNMEVKVDPYEIPYRILLPQKEEVNNLLVTCTLSASHVAYSTIRMEPQYMIIGEAAGTAAGISVNDNKGVHDINVSKLQNILNDNNGVLSLTKDEFPDYTANIEFNDSFDDWKKTWNQSHATSSAITVTQNESSITLKRSPMQNYGYITRKNFVAPIDDFTVGFRAKLNSTGKVEFAIRSSEYLIKVVLTRNENNLGSALNTYLEPTKSYSFDTSVYHDYRIVVKKGTNSNYTYDLYVDDNLAWENATNDTGFGTDMFKIGMDGAVKVGEQTTLDVDLDYAYVSMN